MNSGYGYGPSGGYAATRITVGQPSPYVVSSMPPDPLYEQMSVSPGAGHVWIDGSWHWNGFEWVWLGGRWQRTQTSGLVYVQPHYHYVEGRYSYTPGYWSRRERVPPGWNVRAHRDGRPTFAAPPPGYRPPPPPPGPYRNPAVGGYRPTPITPAPITPAPITPAPITPGPRPAPATQP